MDKIFYINLNEKSSSYLVKLDKIYDINNIISQLSIGPDTLIGKSKFLDKQELLQLGFELDNIILKVEFLTESIEELLYRTSMYNDLIFSDNKIFYDQINPSVFRIKFNIYNKLDDNTKDLLKSIKVRFYKDSTNIITYAPSMHYDSYPRAESTNLKILTKNYGKTVDYQSENNSKDSCNEFVDNVIHIIRGDTLDLEVEILTPLGEKYILQDGDKISFTVKTSVNDTVSLIKKEFTSNRVLIKPEDTKDLPYGTYIYDCQLTTKAGEISTFIPPSKFIIEEEVTF